MGRAFDKIAAGLREALEVVTTRTESPPADLALGSTWALYAAQADTRIPTADGPVVVERGGYGRFRMTERGWVRDE